MKHHHTRMIPNTNEIGSYVHCDLCLQQRPHDISPSDYARLEVGFTPLGVQVWCRRHEVNVMHIDFEGERHLANATRRVDKRNDKHNHKHNGNNGRPF